ncbi:MAG: hypothetical protein R3B13_10645 [Polyangiaceae bacterium]
MVVSTSVKKRYDDLAAHAPALQALVREQLVPICESANYGLADRIKTLDSFAEKLETGRVKSWDELDDLYAATVIVPSLRDEARVLELLDNAFERVALRQRSSTRMPPDVFRFDSPRFIGRLRASPEREGSPLKSTPFEVQIRTAFEHAWSTTTHALSYKADHVDWKRHRLAAALRASVEQIDLAIAGFERTAEEVLPGQWEESELKRQMLRRFKSLFEARRLPSELRPSAWNRFIDNVYALCRAEANRRNRRGRAAHAEVTSVVKDALDCFENWANATAINGVPRSLSLYQTTFGVLADKAVLAPGLDIAVFGIADIVALFAKAAGVAATEL